MRQCFLQKSGFKLWHIQNGVFDLDSLQTRSFVFVSYNFVPGDVFLITAVFLIVTSEKEHSIKAWRKQDQKSIEMERNTKSVQ